MDPCILQCGYRLFMTFNWICLLSSTCCWTSPFESHSSPKIDPNFWLLFCFVLLINIKKMCELIVKVWRSPVHIKNGDRPPPLQRNDRFVVSVSLLTGKPAWLSCCGICLSLSADHQLLPLSAESFCSTSIWVSDHFFFSPLFHLRPQSLHPLTTSTMFTDFWTPITGIHAYSYYHKCSVNRQDEGECSLLGLKYSSTLFQYSNHLCFILTS